ncbi:MAG: glycosyltransferase [Bacteroidetes bacterium]|nr:glycosyltransferase [Bacteroidota bacterium]
MPRIAIISPNHDAWSETFIAAHIQRLPGVKLVLTDGFLPQRDAQGVSILPSSLGHRVRRRLIGGGLDRHLRTRIRELLIEHRIEVVLAEYGPTGMAMREICHSTGIPLVVHFHGVDAFHQRLLDEHDQYRALFPQAAAIIAVSREMEAQLLALGSSRERTHYNCYGIDVDRFMQARPGKAPPQLLAVGRFADTKAPYLTLLAFHQAWQRFPDLRLTIGGQGPLWETCHQLVRTLGLEGAVSLPGVLTHEAVARAMQGSRAFVQHSLITSQSDREGTPLAILEALSSGLPVIATRHAGIADVVRDGINGLLCDERDISGMAEHMLRVASDPKLAERLGNAGRGDALTYRQEDSLARLHAILAAAALSPRKAASAARA